MADVLVSGSERSPSRWRQVPKLAVGAALLAVLAVGLLALASGAADPRVVPPSPLAVLGPAVVRVDDGGLLVRVEAPLRSREPVVLRSGTVSGVGFVVLVDPVPAPGSDAPDAVSSQVVALVDPGCPAAAQPSRGEDARLQVVVASQDGGEAAELSSDVPLRALDAAATAACAPVRASATLAAGDGPVARQLEITVRVPDGSVPVRVVALTGRGFQVDADGLAGQVGAASERGRPFEVTASVAVSVSDCVVEVQAPRRLVLEVQRGDDLLPVPVAVERRAVAGLDELVRRSCRRPRG